MNTLFRHARRRRWDLERFGYTPSKLARRVTNRHVPKVFLNSIPKSGTHLLERALCLHPRLYRRVVPTLHLGTARTGEEIGSQLPRRPGQVAVGHLPFRRAWHEAIERSGCRMVLMARDPRDALVSTMHYALSRREHRLHQILLEEPDSRRRLLMLINGVDGLRPSVSEVIAPFGAWTQLGVPVVRFEELVGSHGGGSDDVQRRTLAHVFAYLELETPEPLLDRIQRRLFSDASPTFRQGSVGAWRDVFDDQIREAFKSEAGDVLVAMGYADSHDW